MEEYYKSFYCYVVCVDDGFYFEPDVSVYKVFLNYKDAEKCCKHLKKNHRYVFIEKRKLFL